MAMKTQAIELLQDIPDDKVGLVVEMLKGLRLLYTSAENSSEITADNAMGVFSKYANPDLAPLEKEAWGMAVTEKHAAH